MKELSPSKLKIYNVALELFASKGYTSTSMSDIADAVGIRKASLYSHFKNKLSIFELILESILLEHKDELRRLLAGLSASNSLDKLEQVFFDYVNYCKGNVHIDFWTRFYYFPPSELRERIHDATHQAERIFMDAIEEIIADGIRKNEIKGTNAHDIMLSYYHLLIGFVMSLNFYKNTDPTSDMKSCISVFLLGLKS